MDKERDNYTEGLKMVAGGLIVMYAGSFIVGPESDYLVKIVYLAVSAFLGFGGSIIVFRELWKREKEVV